MYHTSAKVVSFMVISVIKFYNFLLTLDILSYRLSGYMMGQRNLGYKIGFPFMIYPNYKFLGCMGSIVHIGGKW